MPSVPYYRRLFGHTVGHFIPCSKMVDRTELFKATVRSSKLLRSRLDKEFENHELEAQSKQSGVTVAGAPKTWDRNAKFASFSRKAKDVVNDCQHILLFFGVTWSAIA